MMDERVRRLGSFLQASFLKARTSHVGVRRGHCKVRLTSNRYAGAAGQLQGHLLRHIAGERHSFLQAPVAGSEVRAAS